MIVEPGLRLDSEASKQKSVSFVASQEFLGRLTSLVGLPENGTEYVVAASHVGDRLPSFARFNLRVLPLIEREKTHTVASLVFQADDVTLSGLYCLRTYGENPLLERSNNFFVPSILISPSQKYLGTLSLRYPGPDLSLPAPEHADLHSSEHFSPMPADTIGTLANRLI